VANAKTGPLKIARGEGHSFTQFCHHSWGNCSTFSKKMLPKTIVRGRVKILQKERQHVAVSTKLPKASANVLSDLGLIALREIHFSNGILSILAFSLTAIHHYFQVTYFSATWLNVAL
jgi:hypothetical protein